jgi:P2 family phage major capsid protein
MRNETRVKFNQFKESLSRLNGVGDVSEKFAVAPTVQQTLETKIQESSAFLQQINNIPVTEQAGSKLGLGVGSTIAGTTDTTKGDRTPTDPTTLDESGYLCTQTNFDTVLRYAKLDLWAKFPNFQTRIRDALVQRQALDIMMIGFNGKTRADTSDRTANPLLQDVNVGWLEKIRKYATPRLMNSGRTAGKIVIQEEGDTNVIDYVSLDALVMDAVNQCIDPWYQGDTSLVAIMGRDLLADKYFPLVNKAQPNSEILAADLIISQKRVGGLQAMTVPFVPAGSILVTRLDNLSRYIQEGGRRRAVIDNPRRDQIENYESSNDAYVVEDYGCACLIENIEVLEKAKTNSNTTTAA